jgi:hypothetical protein
MVNPLEPDPPRTSGSSSAANELPWPPRLEDLVDRAAALLATGIPLGPDGAQHLVEALGIGELVNACTTAHAIIRTADTYHPVAEFFADGSKERSFILRVLRSDATDSPRR